MLQGMQTPKSEVQKAIRERILRDGDVRTARAVGLSRQTIARLAAGLPVNPATIIAACVALGLDTPTPATEAP